MNGTDYEKLFLYEQQSSKNGNMPLRCLFYVSDSYSRMVRFVKKTAPCASIWSLWIKYADILRISRWKLPSNRRWTNVFRKTFSEIFCWHIKRRWRNSGKYEKNRCSKTEQRYHHPFNQKRLSSFYFTGFQAGSTNVHFLKPTVGGFNANRFNVGFPHFIGSSMRMTHFDSEMSTLITNSTSSHDCTSL